MPKLGAVLAIARLLEALPPDRLWPVLVGALAASGMTIGNLGALNQAHVGRLLGWSTISQVGYLMAAAAAVPGSAQARPALLLFLAGYAVTNLGCFAVLASEPERRSLDDWRGMGRTRPGLITSLGVGLLGLVGTPPTAVFVAKLLTIVVTWEAGLPWLAVLVAANTVLSLTYYLRWLASCLSSPTRGAPGQADSGASHPGQETRHPRAAQVAVACAVAAVVLGLLAGPALALASWRPGRLGLPKHGSGAFQAQDMPHANASVNVAPSSTLRRSLSGVATQTSPAGPVVIAVNDSPTEPRASKVRRSTLV